MSSIQCQIPTLLCAITYMIHQVWNLFVP
uniref:Uncharacterized protein n=1 Tax=Rhizophora mucronata TaxID=61149 RepID=A0A2P2R2G2_RHIMU